MNPQIATLFLLTAFTTAIPALAENTPDHFGPGHDNPRTAYPSPVPEGLPVCTIDVLQHGFANFEPVHATLDASACPGPWHKVVLRLDGAVKGRQYDRIGHLAIGGITIFRTSTPEPSPEGITWQVEKDITAYAPLLTTPQSVEMVIGNVVNETYTGIFDVRVQVQFFRADADHPAEVTADHILALDDLREDGQDTLGMVVVPNTAMRVMAEVYATGSGGGCEEFWYFAAPSGNYWCQASHGPYREVQVLIDGRLAGIAAPYPHIYTGGWSNPFLWYTIPAPRAFNIEPVQYELTPFIGLLNDGKPHEIRFRVVGLDGGREGWKLMPNVQVWNTPDGQPISVKLIQAGIVESSSNSTLTSEDNAHLSHTWHRHFVANARMIHTGVQESMDIRIERRLQGEIGHHWMHEEDRDDRLKGQWRDEQTVTIHPPEGQGDPVVQHLNQVFGLDGSIVTTQVDGMPRITTTLDITDERDLSSGLEGQRIHTRDHFNGSASWTRGERARRRALAQATGHSRQTWSSQEYPGVVSLDGDHAPIRCRECQIASRNGVFIEHIARDECGERVGTESGR